MTEEQLCTKGNLSSIHLTQQPTGSIGTIAMTNLFTLADARRQADLIKAFPPTFPADMIALEARNDK